jgi:hypothetical protein
MVSTQPEKKTLATQRRIRRLRQQRLLSGSNHLPNGNSALHANAVAVKGEKGHPISDLGWTREDAIAAYYTFKSFEENWNVPGMELYYDL